MHLPYMDDAKGPRCFTVDGYSLHANTFSQSVETYKLRRSLSDATTHIVFTQLKFIEKLSALVPKPCIHLI